MNLFDYHFFALESGALVAAGVVACPAGVLAAPPAGGAPLFYLLFLFLSMSY